MAESRSSDVVAQLVELRRHHAINRGVSWISPDLHTGDALLYVSQYQTNNIQIYRQSGSNQSPIGTIENGLSSPEGMWVTHNGDLYVANTDANNILVFKKGHVNSYKTLADPSEYPWDVTVDASGTVYVTNIEATNDRGSVSVYASGATRPTKRYSVPNNLIVLYEALDDDATLYVNYIPFSSARGAVVKFYQGSSTPHTTPVTFGQPGGMKFDNTGDMITVNEFGSLGFGPFVEIFELPSDTPSFEFGLDNMLPTAVALARDERQVYVADSRGGMVHRYSYPGGVEDDTIVNGLGTSSPPGGVATDPGAPL